VSKKCPSTTTSEDDATQVRKSMLRYLLRSHGGILTSSTLSRRSSLTGVCFTLSLALVAVFHTFESLGFAIRTMADCRMDGIDTHGCCDDIRMDPPYFYEDWKKVLAILEALDRPWFASGGWGLFALRTAGFGFKAANASDKRRWGDLHMDDDMDVTIIFHDEKDQAEKYIEVTALCERAGGLMCARNMAGNGSSILFDSSKTFNFALWSAHINESEDAIAIVEVAGYNYNLPISRIMPLKYTRFHDTTVRVPNDYMWVYSHLRPWSPPKSGPKSGSLDNRQVEYGQGCMKLAYPAFLHQSFGIPENNPINSSLDFYEDAWQAEKGLVKCAFCLERHGCASFASCFRPT